MSEFKLNIGFSGKTEDGRIVNITGYDGYYYYDENYNQYDPDGYCSSENMLIDEQKRSSIVGPFNLVTREIER